MALPRRDPTELDRTEQHPARSGALSMAPIALGLVPFALAIGSAAAAAGAPLAGWAGSWLIFGGSAHLAALHALASGGGAAVAITTALVINVRLVVYAGSLRSRWRDQPRWFRALAPAFLTEATWAFAEQQPSMSPTAHRRFFLGSALTLGAAWSASIAVGAIAGGHLPNVGLELAAPLCLLAALARRLRDARHRAAAVAAAVTALAFAGWPAGTGMLAAVAAGSSAARLADALRPARAVTA